ncbi:MAG: peroxiredoxin, partial [Rhodococcus sp. (in: high G+C Gram-positive bacteria)]
MAVESTMIALGTPAPAFELPDRSGGLVRLADFDA